jgi:hypothetical protein
MKPAGATAATALPARMRALLPGGWHQARASLTTEAAMPVQQHHEPGAFVAGHCRTRDRQADLLPSPATVIGWQAARPPAPSRKPGATLMSSKRRPDRPARPPDRSPPSTQPAATPPRTGDLRAAARGFWADARGYQRLAYLVGAGLILVGLAHAGIWAVTGGSATGALSWRKPTTFGISFGLTTLTLGWVAGYLPVRRAVGWLAPACCAPPPPTRSPGSPSSTPAGCPPTSTTPPCWTSACSSPTR